MKNIKDFARVLFLATSLASAIALAYTPETQAAQGPDHQQGLIEGALTYYPHLRIAELEVGVDRGRAQLKGVVDSQTSKALAEELAASVKGVRSVSNQLRVVPEYFDQRKQLDAISGMHDQRLSNVTISNKVKSQLLANRVTSGMNVDVETRSRVVTISGEVQSEAEKDLTYWIAKNTRGVRAVINNLHIQPAHEQQAFVQLDNQ